ncbi:hypothetical protein QE152_g25762 [Popillia japonica]|uniref:Uncharacterized protein n=1 Tax=Popillia japonica TaxID=7064 RepID=A0AAW1JZ06_POPJA
MKVAIFLLFFVTIIAAQRQLHEHKIDLNLTNVRHCIWQDCARKSYRPHCVIYSDGDKYFARSRCDAENAICFAGKKYKVTEVQGSPCN